MRQSVISHSTGCSKIYIKVQLQLTRRVKVDCKKNSEHRREKHMKIKTNLNCVQNISVYISNNTSNPKVCPFLIRRRDFSVISELSSSLPVCLYRYHFGFSKLACGGHPCSTISYYFFFGIIEVLGRVLERCRIICQAFIMES